MSRTSDSDSAVIDTSCLGDSMMTSCAPTPFMRSYMPSPRFSRPPSTIRAGNLLETTRAFQRPSERTEMISGGVMFSLPGQNAQGRFLGSSIGSCAYSSGRRERSDAMMTQRPATGSRLSSGMRVFSRPSNLPVDPVEIRGRHDERQRRQRRQPDRRPRGALELEEEFDLLAGLQPQIPEAHRAFEDRLRHPGEPGRDLTR